MSHAKNCTKKIKSSVREYFTAITALSLFVSPFANEFTYKYIIQTFKTSDSFSGKSYIHFSFVIFDFLFVVVEETRDYIQPESFCFEFDFIFFGILFVFFLFIWICIESFLSAKNIIKPSIVDVWSAYELISVFIFFQFPSK